MELRIDFYSKDEISIKMDFKGRYPFPANEAGELFLFTCFTLRKLSNLGNNQVSLVLSVLLTKFDEEKTINLANNKFVFPDKDEFNSIIKLRGFKIGVDYNVFKKAIMPGLPRQVEFRGDGKKAFIVTMPPFRMKLKGFGLLGFQVNYYAFQSVIGLYRYFAKKNINNSEFLVHLSQVAKYCGDIHISHTIPPGDHIPLANTILEEVGISLQEWS